MATDLEPDDEQIQRFVEQLYEDERLTDALTDRSASLLLTWGEGQLKRLGELNLDHATLDRAAQRLRWVIRRINRLIEQQADLSETEMVEQLLMLVNGTLQYRHTYSIEAEEPSHGQEEQNLSQPQDPRE
jgi:mannitol-1-phosphate/altronate dehydrogenase